MSQSPESCWWAPRAVPVARTLECRLGALTLSVHHAHGEWQLDYSHGDELDAPAVAQLVMRDGALTGEGVHRFMVADPDPQLVLQPLLADRPVVIRPRQPVYLPQGEETTLYMSSPVTLRVQVGARERLLQEIVTLPLSDTWFGPSTREGELCYAGRTHARHGRAELPRRAHRVVTAVTIRNRAEAPLPLDKLSLPVQVLSLYGGADGSLWTEPVSLVRDSASDLAELNVEAGAPEFAGPVTLLSGPRLPRGHSALVRAFSALFGDGS